MEDRKLEEMKEKIISILSEQICKKLGKNCLSLKLRKDLKMDSLDMVEVVMTLEDTFEIEEGIFDEDVDKWKTVQDVIDYIKEK